MDKEQINRLTAGDYSLLKEHYLEEASEKLNSFAKNINPNFFINSYEETISLLEKALFFANQENDLVEKNTRLKQEELDAFKEWRKTPKKPAA